MSAPRRARPRSRATKRAYCRRHRPVDAPDTGWQSPVGRAPSSSRHKVPPSQQNIFLLLRTSPSAVNRVCRDLQLTGALLAAFMHRSSQRRHFAASSPPNDSLSIGHRRFTEIAGRLLVVGISYSWMSCHSTAQSPCASLPAAVIGRQRPPGHHNLIPRSARAHTYIHTYLGQPAARADSLKELSARSALGNFQLRPKQFSAGAANGC